MNDGQKVKVCIGYVVGGEPLNLPDGEYNIIAARDKFHDWADKLAEAIAKHFNADIGEHSSANCPWTNALEVIEAATAPPAGEAIPAQPFDFHAHLARQAAFSLKTFGPGRRTVGVCDHIRKELVEIAAKPDDLGEWIDVAIPALDGAWRCGGSPEQIISGIVAKQTKNEGRVWPDWRTADPDKAIEHDRSHDAAPVIPAQTGTGASIDTAEFRALFGGYETALLGMEREALNDLITHINAYGQQQRTEGHNDMHEMVELLKKEGDRLRDERDTAVERAEKAEAAIAEHAEIERLYMELDKHLAKRRGMK